MRCFHERSSRNRSDLNSTERTIALARAAATPSFTSRLIRMKCCSMAPPKTGPMNKM